MFIHLARAKRDKIKVDEDSMFHSIGESLSTKTYFYRVSYLLVLSQRGSTMLCLLGLDGARKQNYRGKNCFECRRERCF